jgi:PAP2 superfamily protein
VTIAVITAEGIRETSRVRSIRALAPLYPPLVSAVVLLTANHYVVDAVSGWALGRLALRGARRLER